MKKYLVLINYADRTGSTLEKHFITVPDDLSAALSSLAILYHYDESDLDDLCDEIFEVPKNSITFNDVISYLDKRDPGLETVLSITDLEAEKDIYIYE